MMHLRNKLVKVLSKHDARDQQSLGALSFVSLLLGRQSTERKVA